MSRVVVVGAGLGGLAVAARLARLRHDVVVFEQAETVGGRLGCYEREGFRFDTGPSTLTLPAPLRDLFVKTGRMPLESVLELVPVEPVARYRFPDGTFLDVPNTGRHDVEAAFDAALGGTAGRDWDRFVTHAGRMWDAVRVPLLESPVDDASALVRLAVRNPAQLVAVAPWRTLRRAGRRFFRDPRQRLYVEHYATFAGSDPRRSPGMLAILAYVEHTFGTWWVRGGLRRIVEAVHDRAVERGASVVTAAQVTGITTSGGRVDGVRLADGRLVPADVVVSDVDAGRLYSTLLPDPEMQHRLAGVTPGASAFVLLLGVRGRTRGMPHRTVLFPDDADAELDAVFGPRPRPVDDPTLHVSVRADDTMAPPGHESWVVLVTAPWHGSGRGAVDWDTPGTASGYAARMLDRLAARGHDVRDRLVFAEHRSPADVERVTLSPGGATYGPSGNGVRAAFLRPANRGAVPGLFLVGGSAHPGGGLPFVTASAAIVADLIGRA